MEPPCPLTDVLPEVSANHPLFPDTELPVRIEMSPETPSEDTTPLVI
jgi:hypothetical protein